jgi:hypothetical protein
MTAETVDDDSPSVIGPAAPMPTVEEGWAAWRRAYVARWVERGFEASWGEANFDAEPNAYELSDNPADSADDDMSYLEDDGDGPV